MDTIWQGPQPDLHGGSTRYHRSLRFREGESGQLQSSDNVPGVGCLPQRILCITISFTVVARSIEDAQLTRRIEAIHKTSRETYGVPRIHAELIEDDERVSRKRIARLMRDQGLQGVCRRKRVTTTVRDPRDRVVPDLVDRDFYASAPDEL